MAGKTKKELLLPAQGMDLQASLFCGQTFSWQKQGDNQFAGAVAGQAVLARQQGDSLRLTRLDNGDFTVEERAFWHQYFALDLDYGAIQKKLQRHGLLAQCVQDNAGIRVLRQPFFETLLSFIISQNNHIPRIVGIVQRLQTHFGPLLAPGMYGFPAPQTLAERTVEDLACLRAGFRAKYLLDAARKVAAGQVVPQAMADMDNQQARAYLCQIAGVGPKVADCVLLFSLGRWDIVPMDVWMKRALHTYFKGKMPACSRGYEGIAQQYIFHWVRQRAAEKGGN